MASLPVTFARKVFRRTCTSSVICSLCMHPIRRILAKSAMPSVRIRRSWNCIWPRTLRANPFRARNAARILRANIIWIVIWSSPDATSRARNRSCLARCATKCLRDWTICGSTCECIWDSLRGARSTNVRFVIRSFMGRRY